MQAANKLLLPVGPKERTEITNICSIHFVAALRLSSARSKQSFFDATF
jgi:hypothetical protein